MFKILKFYHTDAVAQLTFPRNIASNAQLVISVAKRQPLLIN